MINKKNRDCLNLIRLLAAVQVFFGHAFIHLEVQMPHVISLFIKYFPGVPIFFALSGYLIWDSVERSKDYKTFLKKRFYRIYPEMWVAIILEILVMILLYKSKIPLIDLILFIFTQATIFQFWTPSSLRGYGCGTPNGSLWTIGVIIQFYFIVYFIYKWLHNKNIKSWVLFYFISLLCSFGISHLTFLPDIIQKLLGQLVFNYLYLFLIGIFISEYKHKLLPLIQKYWPLAFILYTLYSFIPFKITLASYDLIGTILIFVCWLGFAYRFPKLNIKRDLSFGIYIYHMTVVNAFITLNLMNNIIYVIFVLMITLLLAYISSRTIGNMVSRKKVLLNGK